MQPRYRFQQLGNILVAMLAFLTPCSTGAADPPSRDAVVADLEQQAAILRRVAEGTDASIRGTLRFAVEAAGNDWNPQMVEEALRVARSMQDTDSASPRFGNYRWRKNDPAVSDLNAVEFATTLTALLRLEYAERLTPAARDLLDAMNRDAVVGMKNHAVGEGYTNIFLKKVWCHLALGRVYGGDLGDTGRRLWQSWLAHTRTHGLSEYSSPTYYGVTLDTLGLIHRHATDEAIRRESQAAIEFVWNSIAANWFVASERLSGPSSRAYDYLFGHGYCDEHLSDAGWLTRPLSFDGGGWLAGAPQSHLRVVRDARRRDPPASLREMAVTEVPRFVVQRFNERPWGRATNWVGRSCSIGVAGECVGPEDKTLVINFPGTPATPNVTLVFDGRGDPYGRIRQPVGYDKHHKAHHLRPFVIASQRGPRVTAAWYFDPAHPPPGAGTGQLDCLLAHLILPVDVAIWSAEGLLPDDATVPVDGVVFLRKDDVAVGIRFIPTAGNPAAPQRIGIHADGAPAPAKRITVGYADETPRRPALLPLDIELRDDCNDADFTHFRAAFAARNVTSRLEANVLRIDGTLPLEADVDTFKRIAFEPFVNTDTLLRVNEREIGLPLLLP